MNKFEYQELCKKESNLTLDKIICPYCGYIYDTEKSIEYGVGYDCEDEIVITCEKCGKKIKVHSNCTIVRFWTVKADYEG